jgi:hypothetical protein
VSTAYTCAASPHLSSRSSTHTRESAASGARATRSTMNCASHASTFSTTSGGRITTTWSASSTRRCGAAASALTARSALSVAADDVASALEPRGGLQTQAKKRSSLGRITVRGDRRLASSVSHGSETPLLSTAALASIACSATVGFAAS